MFYAIPRHSHTLAGVDLYTRFHNIPCFANASPLRFLCFPGVSWPFPMLFYAFPVFSESGGSVMNIPEKLVGVTVAPLIFQWWPFLFLINRRAHMIFHTIPWSSKAFPGHCGDRLSWSVYDILRYSTLFQGIPRPWQVQISSHSKTPILEVLSSARGVVLPPSSEAVFWAPEVSSRGAKVDDPHREYAGPCSK